jgi:hypothetical protein
MALRNSDASLSLGDDDTFQSIPPGISDCSTGEIIAALDYLSDTESPDPVVRKKQHRSLNSLGFNFVRHFNALVVDDRFPWCAMRYLACKYISDGKRFQWAFMILSAIWEPGCRTTQSLENFSIHIGSVTGMVNLFLAPSSESFTSWVWGGKHKLTAQANITRRSNTATDG